MPFAAKQTAPFSLFIPLLELRYGFDDKATQKLKETWYLPDMINYFQFISWATPSLGIIFFLARIKKVSSPMTKPCSETDFKLYNFNSMIRWSFSAPEHSSIIFEFVFNQENFFQYFFHSLIRGHFVLWEYHLQENLMRKYFQWKSN